MTSTGAGHADRARTESILHRESERLLMLTQRPFCVVAQGIDTLVVNARGHLFWEIRHQLDELQARALDERNTTRGRRRAQTLVETPWRLAGQPLLIRSHGGGSAQW